MKTDWTGWLWVVILLFWLPVQAQESDIDSLPDEQYDSLIRQQEKANFAFQTARRAWVVGLDFGLGLGYRNDDLGLQNSTTLLDIGGCPKIGYFVLPRLLVGLNNDIYASFATFGAKTEYSLYNITIGPMVRYYPTRHLLTEIQYGAGVGHEFSDRGRGVEKRNFGGQRFSAGIGISNFWFKRLNIELIARYNIAAGNFSERDLQQTPTVYFSGLSINAGINFRIGK